jgi:hypothetical protein
MYNRAENKLLNFVSTFHKNPIFIGHCLTRKRSITSLPSHGRNILPRSIATLDYPVMTHKAGKISVVRRECDSSDWYDYSTTTTPFRTYAAFSDDF